MLKITYKIYASGATRIRLALKRASELKQGKRMSSKSHVSYLAFVASLLDQGLITSSEAKNLVIDPLQIDELLAWLEFKETGLGKELN